MLSDLTIVEKGIDRFRRRLVHAGSCQQRFNISRADLLDTAEMLHEASSSPWSYAGNIIQDRVDLCLTAERSMIFNGKAVRFILDPRQQTECLGMNIDGYLLPTEDQTARTVPVILDHAAHRDIDLDLSEQFLRGAHLPRASIHQDKVRELHKAAIFLCIKAPFL